MWICVMRYFAAKEHWHLDSLGSSFEIDKEFGEY